MAYVRKILKALSRAIRDLPEPIPFHVAPNEADFHQWKIEFFFQPHEFPVGKVVVEIQFSQNSSEAPRVSIVSPRLTGPNIFEGAICLVAVAGHQWDPDTFDFENFLLTIRTHISSRCQLFTSVLQNPLLDMASPNDPTTYSVEERESGFLHIDAVHPELQPSDETGGGPTRQPSHPDEEKADHLYRLALESLLNDNIQKTVGFFSMAIRTLAKPHYLMERAGFFEDQGALRRSADDLRRCLALLPRSKTVDGTVENLQNRLKRVESRLQAHDPTTIAVGKARCESSECCGLSPTAVGIVRGYELSHILNDVAKDGDTILLYPGTHHCSLFLLKDVTIRGVKCAKCGARPVIQWNSTIVESSCLDGRIEGCDLVCPEKTNGSSKFREDLSSAVRVFEGRLELIDCKILGGGLYIGVLAEYPGAACQVNKCVVNRSSYGCVAQDRGQMVVSNTLIEKIGDACLHVGIYGCLYATENVLSDAKTGIALIEGSAVVENNTIQSMRIGGLIIEKALGMVLVIQNVIKHCDCGIFVRHSPLVVAHSNTIEDSNTSGMAISHVEQFWADQNSVLRSEASAFDIVNVACCTLSSNMIEHSKEHGINVQGPLKNENDDTATATVACVENNIIQHSTLMGVLVDQRVMAMISGNQIHHSGSSGIEFSRGPPEAESSATQQRLFSRRPSHVLSNTISECKVGVSAIHSWLKLTGNLLLANKMGVKLDEQSRAVIRQNFCESLGAPPFGGAIGCLGGSRVLCEGNELFSRASKAAAIYIGGNCVEALVRHNVICAKRTAIVLYDRSFLKMEENVVYNTSRGIEMQNEKGRCHLAAQRNVFKNCKNCKVVFPLDGRKSSPVGRSNRVILRPKGHKPVSKSFVKDCLSLKLLSPVAELFSAISSQSDGYKAGEETFFAD